MICLLVSLGALLLAAAGVARHIWLQRRSDRKQDAAESLSLHLRASGMHEPAEEVDIES